MTYQEFLQTKIEIAEDSGVGYLQAAEAEMEMPTLFDFLEE